LVFYFNFIIFGDRINIAKLDLYYAQPTIAAKASTEALSTADIADEAVANSVHGP
jgi:hypothetical protein